MSAVLKLYEIADMRSILDEWLEESAGELTPELEGLLADIDLQAEDKIERVALYIREQLAIAEAIKLEVKRLGELLAARTRAAESLKGYLKRQMERLDRTKIDGKLVAVRIQQNSQPSVSYALEPHELYALDDARPFVTREEVTQYTVNRAALLGVWKLNPASVPPMFVVEQGSHIRLR